MLQTNTLQNDTIINIIDQVVDHHYFQSRLSELMQNNKQNKNLSCFNQVGGLLDDQYYKAEDDLVGEIADFLSATADSQVRNVLSAEFINVGDEIQAMKKEMFVFMDQQAKKSQQLAKQVSRLAEEVKRRSNTTQVLSNTAVVNSNGYTGGIRFLRSSVNSAQSNINSNPAQNKSFHSELMGLRKEIEQLKEGMEKGEMVKVIEEQFNQFKIETKVALEALKLQTKKMTVDLNSVAKTSSNNAAMAPSIKQNIENSVKRTITAQLKVYASYSDHINEVKAQVQKLQDKLAHQGQMYNQYLSNQLKSVWLVLNDMKRTLDEVTDHIGLNSSREML